VHPPGLLPPVRFLTRFWQISYLLFFLQVNAEKTAVLQNHDRIAKYSYFELTGDASLKKFSEGDKLRLGQNWDKTLKSIFFVNYINVFQYNVQL
jgi:hypothetical protein